VCYVFALAGGVATGAGVGAGDSASPKWLSWGVLAAALAITATVPMRIHAARASANLENIAWGTGPWQAGEDGVKARAIIGQTTLFVPAAARVIEIPVRLDRPGSRVVLSVKYHDHAADDLLVESTSWSRYRLILGNARGEARYEPVILTPKSGDARNVLIGKIVEY
jgi:hypothetical protein